MHKVVERLNVDTGQTATMIYHERGGGVTTMIDGHTTWCCDPQFFTPTFIEACNVIGKGRYIFTLTEKEYEHVES